MSEKHCYACGHLVDLHSAATGRLDTGCAACERLGLHPARVCRLGSGFLLDMPDLDEA